MLGTWIKKLTALLLNDWLQRWRKLSMNLAGSSGPVWTVKELLERAHCAETSPIELGYASLRGSNELRRAIAEMYGLDPDWVVVTNGATEALHLIFAVLGKPGRDALLPAPCYPALPALAKAHHLSVRTYNLTREDQFKIVDQRILPLAITGTTALAVLNTPHNPTGAVSARPVSLRLAELLEEKAIPLVVDEVSHPVYHGESVASLAGCRNVIHVGDLSKAFALPGLRIGWIVDPDAKRRSLYQRARGLMSLGSSPVLERLAVIALGSRDTIVQRTATTAARNLTQLQHFMARTRDILGWVPPEGGLVAFPWFYDGRNTRPLCEKLAAKDVLLVPGDCFGMQDCLRIGLGCEADVFDAALKIIEVEIRDS